MIVRSHSDVIGTDFDVEWGNGRSLRLLTVEDGLEFTVCHTMVRKGTASRLEYRSHEEACYCLSGSGRIENSKGISRRLEPGTIYALNKGEHHFLSADPQEDLVLISVFSPPLKGTEQHKLSEFEASSY